MRNTQYLVLKLSVVALLMFGFSFALVPLYSVFCKATGLNGKVAIQRPETYNGANIDPSSHVVMVEFDVNRHQQLPCEILPEHPILPVIPGQLSSTSYYLKNLSGKKMVIQAIPSISPGTVAQHLKKLECFCFNQQVLQPYESLRLPLRFWLEPEFPRSIHRLTLSYTLFDVTQQHREAGG